MVTIFFLYFTIEQRRLERKKILQDIFYRELAEYVFAKNRQTRLFGYRKLLHHNGIVDNCRSWPDQILFHV